MPTGVTTISGSPVVGETLTCVPSGFSGNGVLLRYQWLRDGAAIGGAGSQTYVPVAADVGRAVSCRVLASNSAGDADSTSEALTVSPAVAGPPGPEGRARHRGSAGSGRADGRDRAAGSGGRGVRVHDLLPARQPAADRRAWSRRSAATARAKRAGVDPRGRHAVATRRSAAAARSASGCRTAKRVRRSARVVVRYTSGKATGRAVVRLGKRVKAPTR